MATTRQLILQAIETAGGPHELARACQVTREAVDNWRRRARVSAEMAVRIERATGGAVTRQQLRPDLFNG